MRRDVIVVFPFLLVGSVGAPNVAPSQGREWARCVARTCFNCEDETECVGHGIVSNRTRVSSGSSTQTREVKPHHMHTVYTHIRPPFSLHEDMQVLRRISCRARRADSAQRTVGIWKNRLKKIAWLVVGKGSVWKVDRCPR